MTYPRRLDPSVMTAQALTGMNSTSLLAQAEVELRAAQHRRDDARARTNYIIGTASQEGRAELSPGETRDLEESRASRTRAREDIIQIQQRIDALHELEAEEAAYQAAQRDVRPAFPAGGGAADYTYALAGPRGHGLAPQYGHSGPQGPDWPGQRAAAPSRGQWVYRDSGRPAAVGRGQRMADHPEIADQIARSAGRDEHVIGMHGSLGQLVRAMSTSSGSAVVPTVWAADIIDRARNLAAVTQAGAEVIPMQAKVVQIGRLTADPAAGFRTEGSTITATDPTFDNVTLTATTLNAFVIGSLEWFQDTQPGGGAEELVTEAIAKAIAVQLDLAALFGGVTTGVEQGGVGNNLLPSGGLPNPPNPRGILATLLAVASSSVLGAATNGTVQTAATFYGEVLDTLFTPRDFNEAPNALLWPSKLARIYAKAADTTNQPMRQPPDVEQITKFVTNQIPSGMTQGTGTLMSDLFVGDFRQLIIGQRLDLQIQTLTERYAELGQIGILATWRGDIQLARPRAFSVYRFLKGT